MPIRPENGGRVTELTDKKARELWALLHRHRWEPTKVNRWYWCFERKCSKCGAVQHTRADDFRWDTLTTTWREGPHPLNKNDEEK